jgi:hypothetical protein
MITRKKNDFLYYEPSGFTLNGLHLGERFTARLVLAGGRVKVPVSLLWATWALIGAVIFTVETVVGLNTGVAFYGPWWTVTGYYLLFTLGWFVIYWPIYAVIFIVRTWVDVVRSAL